MNYIAIQICFRWLVLKANCLQDEVFRMDRDGCRALVSLQCLENWKADFLICRNSVNHDEGRHKKELFLVSYVIH